MDIPVKHRLRGIILALLFGLAAFCVPPPPLHAQDAGHKHILILNSYHQGYPWTDHITDGIESTLKKEFPDLEMHVEYMDTKRVFDKNHFRNLHALLRHKYRNQTFAVVFVSDDNAFQFALAHHKELFPGAPVVFCGVNFFEDSMLRGHAEFTGVVESVDVQNTIDMALKLHPRTRRVIVINDTSESGRALHKDVDEVVPRFGKSLEFVFLEDFTIADVIGRVKDLPPDSIVLFLIFFRDKSGHVFSYDESFRMISRHISVPIYSLWDIYYGKGIVGGSLIEGFSHGEKAAKLALRILRGAPPSRIPVVKKGQNHPMFDYHQMVRFGIKTPDLPPGSTVINRSVSFYSVNKGLIRSGIAVLLVLLYLVALLGLNIHRRKRVEAEMKRSYEMTRDILDKSPYGIFVVNHDGAVDYVNPAMLRMSGDVSREEFMGLRIYDLPGYVSAGIPEKISAVFGGEPFFLGPIEYTSYLGRKTTTRNFIGMPFREQTENKALIFVEDITAQKKAENERAKLEEQLHHAQKMEAVGHLAGGIAHDFNNIMTAIVGYGDLLNMKVTDEDPRKTYVEQILDASTKATALTKRLLAFSRKQIINPKPVDLNEVVKRMEKLLMHLIGEDIELKTSAHTAPLTVRADTGQLEQVLLNLATNARDAMSKGGVLAIRTERAFVGESLIRDHPYMKPGEYALLSVTDRGAGIEPETVKRIFEPFFTTKEPGKGTGLGLSVVYGIIKQHEGFINVESGLENGTTFRIYLPLIGGEAESPASGRPAAGGSMAVNGAETVLVAEDDAHIRSLIKKVLEEFGYTIIEAADGEEAVRAFADNKDSIRLAIMDIIMPKKNGKEVYDEIRRANPDVRALFISGYTADIIHRKGILEEELNFLAKPVSTADLLRKVREVLDKTT